MQQHLVFFFIGILGFSLTGCGEKHEQQATETKLIRPAKVAVVKPHSANAVRYFPATIEPTVKAQLAFRVNGELAALNIVAGQNVQFGEVLAELDDKDFKLQVKQAQAKYDLSLSQFSRAKSLFKDKLVSSSVFDEAAAQFDIAQAQLEVAQRNLQYTKITAPFSGTVAQMFIENYEFIQAKQPIIELQGRDQVDVSIDVPERLMVHLPKNEDGKLYQPLLFLDAAPEKSYLVTFKEHDITANKATKTYRVVFSLDAPADLNLLSGMTGKLAVELDKVLNTHNTALLVPIEAVFIPNKFAGQNKHFIYKLDAQNKTTLVEINVSKIAQYGAEITPVDPSALQIGDQIIAAGSHFLTVGQQVRPWVRERGL
ncbi:efflux RND transporter periplasmic adaptor subunit [Psychrosphaera sp. B3R10]|uniref:efflux RND transporter periplasmic adaptor subunit n=1 Tax=unclassified Psychrosphaera TaxID=2641570 RepID=UPI001C084F2F|nr:MULTISPECIES: efflux RND transporter periplasmic adaptor subunit [unclassified Psychrosphaera]MBU2881801.1 efflux RND transporter periplasmic adaptor subunit [Psychrosphaera sp. I2R16]MBU2988081.1 efflux RND transporter periplasmic adaptor subunit [Psychrosphaera sp. B3R10]